MKCLILAAVLYATCFNVNQAYGQRLVSNRNLNTATVETILKHMGQKGNECPYAPEKIPEVLFGKSYDPALPDLIVILHGDGPDSVALIRNGKRAEDLYGKRYLWVILLSTDSLYVTESSPESTTTTVTSKGGNLAVERKTIIKGADGHSVAIRHEPLEYRPGVGETALAGMIRAVTSGLGAKPPEEKGAAAADKTYFVHLDRAGVSADRTGLYYGSVKLSLLEQTTNRVRVRRQVNKDVNNSLYATFSNFSGSSWGASLAVGATFGAEADSINNGAEIRPMILAHFYVIRPRLPKPDKLEFFGPWSLSLVGGTRLDLGNLFEDLFVGVGIGHVVSSVGAVAGVNFREEKTWTGRTIRKGRFLAGINLAL